MARRRKKGTDVEPTVVKAKGRTFEEALAEGMANDAVAWVRGETSQVAARDKIRRANIKALRMFALETLRRTKTEGANSVARSLKVAS